MRILLVEDSSITRKAVLMILSRLLGPAQVTQAANGQEALYHFLDQAFDLIITDWNMPDMDGLTLVTRVRAHPTNASVPIIMITARATQEDVVKAMAAGVSAYIAKPFNRNELTDKIQQLVPLPGV